MIKLLRKLRYFYINKYLTFKGNKYPMSYDFKHKVLWFRMSKACLMSTRAMFEAQLSSSEFYYGSHVRYNKKLFKNWYKFAIVRDPVDRFLSCYQDKVKNNNMYNLPSWNRNVTGFIEFIRSGVCNDEHIALQSDLFPSEEMDYIVLFEDYDEDIKKVCNDTGLKYIHKHLNKTSDKPTLTELERIWVRHIYRKDYELLNLIKNGRI